MNLPFPSPPPVEVTARFAMIISGLCANLVGRSHLPGRLGSAIGLHIGRIQQRFRMLVEQVRAGKVRPERPRRSRARAVAADGKPDVERVVRPAPASELPRVPRGFSWLRALVPETFGYSGQLRHLLDDPEMVAMLAASPGLRRLFRSMFRMLGVTELPPQIRLPQRERRVVARAAGSAEDRGAGLSPPTAATDGDGLKPTRRSASRPAIRSARGLGRLPDLGSAAWVAAMRRHAGGGGFSSA